MPTYPSVLPPCVRDGFTSAKKKSISAKPMEDGRPRIKRQFSNQPVTFLLTWRFNWEQLAIFEAFLEYECQRGAIPFDMVIYQDRPPFSVRLVAGQEGGYAVKWLNGAWEVQSEAEYIDTPITIPAATGLLPDWIADFPEPEQANYGYDYKDAVARSNIETGLAEQRRRFGERVTNYRLTWIVDADQKDVFDDYVKNTLVDGLSWFNAPFINGIGVATVRARFLSPPSVTPLGAAYNISATLLTINPPVLSQVDYEAAIEEP